jgi:hypothetical protein
LSVAFAQQFPAPPISNVIPIPAEDFAAFARTYMNSGNMS